MDDIATLERDLSRKLALGKGPFTFLSRGRRYTFYWLRSGHRMAVKIHRKPRPPARPDIEALAQKLRATWSCPECGKVFTRRGRQKFCSPAHAARHRKHRYLRRHARRAKREETAIALASRRGYKRDQIDALLVERRRGRPRGTTRRQLRTSDERHLWQ